MIIGHLANVLRDRYDPEQIVLFGSYATGRPTRQSDIDVLIIKDTNQPFFRRLFEVRQLVSQVRHGYPFDPIVLTPEELQRRLAMGDQFFEEIMTRGKVLYAKG